MSGASRWLLGFTLSVTSLSGWAIGTPSGQTVTNTVTADFQISGVPQVQQSDSVSMVVDNKVNLSIGITNVTVSPSQTDRVLTFVIINQGNRTQGYALTVANSSVADDFNMNNVRLYVESGAVAGFDPTDTLYTSGSGNNAGNLDPNSALPGADRMTVYVVANVPPNGGGTAPLDTNTARYDLLVTTLDAGTTTVTVGNNAAAWNSNIVQNVFAEGNPGPFAGDANNDGKLSATGVYSVNAPAVSMLKTATVLDPLGGTNPVTGATITYTLSVSVTGSGAANNVVVTDAIPANTTYVSPSLKLNSVAQTDPADADAGDFNITNANSITVNLGTLTNASATQIITFAVKIN